MPLLTEWVRFENQVGYLARPDRANTPLPSLVVVQEVWGVDEHIQDVTRRLASAGYAALAPDLYAPGGQRPPALAAERIAEVQTFMASLAPAVRGDPAAREAAMLDLPEPARTRTRESHRAIYANLAPGRLDALLPGLHASITYLQETCAASRGQKVACVGFCMGGGLTALLACEEPRLAGAAIFYGSSPPADRVPAIACPLIGFYGSLDPRIGAGLPAFIAALDAAGKRFEPHVYQGAQHAFFNDTRAAYDVRAARDAYARLLEFLRQTTA